MEAYERLRTEIVKSAVSDYRKALKKTDRIGAVCREQRALERWFLSPWGQMLSGDNGELIIEKCRGSYKGKPKTRHPRHLDEETQKKLYHDYVSGVRYKDLMQKYKIASKTLYSIVKRWEK